MSRRQVLQYPPGGLQEGLPFRDQGFRGCPGSLQGSQGQKQPETTLLWGISVLDLPPPTPKPTGLSHPHQLLQTLLHPSGGPNSERASQTPFPMLHPLPQEALSDPLPGCQAKPRWGAGKGRGKGKRRSPLLCPLLTGLQSNSPTTEPLMI